MKIVTNTMKVILFDVFGTVFNLDGVSRHEVGEYVRHVHQRGWSPLILPKSWELIPAHADAAEGVARLRRQFTVVTLSNGPVDLLVRMSRNAGISWDFIVPVQCRQVYKPHPDAYRMACEMTGVEATDCLMVTANPGFGDVEASRAIGMQAQVIRHADDPEFPEWKGCPKDILELAERLGC